MIILENANACVGCGLCADACPKQCITLEPRADGFLYPHIQQDICISCEKCRKVCPVNASAVQVQPQATYAIRDRDINARMKSASGGVGGQLAHAFLQQGGSYVGVRLNDDYGAVHDVCTDIKDIDLYRDSKYLQSDMHGIYQKISDALAENKPMLITGTPCQIAALHKRFGTRDKLFYCELICHGVPSPRVFREYIHLLSEREGKPVKNFYFRDKTNGWKKSNVRVVFADGTQKIITRVESEFWRLFGSNMIFRKSCHHCVFRKFNTYADLAIGDFWKIDSFAPALNDDKGVSMVIAYTDKGQTLVDMLRDDCEIEETNLSETLLSQTKLTTSTPESNYRDGFFKMLSKGSGTKNFQKCFAFYSGKSIFHKIARKLYR